MTLVMGELCPDLRLYQHLSEVWLHLFSISNLHKGISWLYLLWFMRGTSFSKVSPQVWQFHCFIYVVRAVLLTPFICIWLTNSVLVLDWKLHMLQFKCASLSLCSFNMCCFRTRSLLNNTPHISHISGWFFMQLFWAFSILVVKEHSWHLSVITDGLCISFGLIAWTPTLCMDSCCLSPFNSFSVIT